MRMSHFFIDRPIFASVVSVVFVILGAVAFSRLPVAQYPEIAPPVINVSGQYPGASAETVASTVVAPIEEQINGVENMLYLSSNSSGDGRFSIQVTFDIGTNLDIAQVQVLRGSSAMYGSGATGGSNVWRTYGWSLGLTVILLDVSDEEAMSRMLGRAAEEGRSDDAPEAIANRLKLYHELTHPVVERYRGAGELVAVVCHGGVIEQMTKFALGLDPGRRMGQRIEHCSLTEVEHGPARTAGPDWPAAARACPALRRRSQRAAPVPRANDQNACASSKCASAACRPSQSAARCAYRLPVPDR